MTMLVEAPSTVRPEVRLTAEDLLRLPDSHGLELVDGKLVEKNRGARASEVGAEVVFRLKLHCRTTGHGRVFDAECGYRLFPDRPNLVRKPDVSFVAGERLTQAEVPRGHFALAPDLAVEVVSPNDLAYEVSAKVAEYFAAGVREVWVVYPEEQLVEQRWPGGGGRWLGDRDTLTSEDLLPGFACPVSELFPPPAGQAHGGGSE